MPPYQSDEIILKEEVDEFLPISAIIVDPIEAIGALIGLDESLLITGQGDYIWREVKTHKTAKENCVKLINRISLFLNV